MSTSETTEGQSVRVTKDLGSSTHLDSPVKSRKSDVWQAHTRARGVDLLRPAAAKEGLRSAAGKEGLWACAARMAYLGVDVAVVLLAHDGEDEGVHVLGVEHRLDGHAVVGGVEVIHAGPEHVMALAQLQRHQAAPHVPPPAPVHDERRLRVLREHPPPRGGVRHSNTQGKENMTCSRSSERRSKGPAYLIEEVRLGHRVWAADLCRPDLRELRRKQIAELLHPDTCHRSQSQCTRAQLSPSPRLAKKHVIEIPGIAGFDRRLSLSAAHHASLTLSFSMRP